MPEKTVHIPNIHCGGCANTIKNELQEIDGVQRVEVNVEERAATIEWAEPATWNIISEVLEDIEYPAQL